MMTKVIDLFTRQPSDAVKRTATELSEYLRARAGPDFVKERRGMVITPETKAQTDELFEMMALGIRGDAAPERQINTWAWLGSRVATALTRYDRDNDFNLLERGRRDRDFVEYIEAITTGRNEDASAAAKRLGVYAGFDDDHPFAKAMKL